MTQADKSHSFVLFCVVAILSVGGVTCEDGAIQNGKHEHGARLPRVVGGFNATEGQFKYTVSLQIFSSLHYCGGAIISRRTIITAAHCSKPYVIYAMAGSIYHKDFTAQRKRVEKFIIHDKFDPHTLNYDIALAILADDLGFDDNVHPIHLASGPSYAGDRMTLSGWGYTSAPPPPQLPPNHMQWMQTNVIERSVCDDYHPDVDTNICVFEGESHGICTGDSGGPLVNQEGELVGLISAGYPCAIGYPDSCTDVFMFRHWIIKHIV